MGACDLIPEIEQILESHYKQFQKTQDVDRERARGFPDAPPQRRKGPLRAAGCGPASTPLPCRAPARSPVCPGRHASVPFPHCHRASRGWAVCPAVMRLFRIATGRMLRPVKRETGARRGSTGTIRRMTTVHHRGHGSCSRMISRRDKHRSLSFSRHPLFLIGIGHVAPSCRTN